VAVTSPPAPDTFVTVLTFSDYEDFLIPLGSVFVPMSAVLIADFYVLARVGWLGALGRRVTA
jgi:hypothetical protein